MKHEIRVPGTNWSVVPGTAGGKLPVDVLPYGRLHDVMCLL